MTRFVRLRCAGLLLSFAPALIGQTEPSPAAAVDRKLERTRRREAVANASPVRPPDVADLSYGPDKNNMLDLWLAKSARPAPLVVFIHGGGFVGGDKSVASPANIRRCLEQGVSYAAINYRFRTQVPIQTVLRDCARAVQFLRSKSKEFNLDKTRVAAMGGSAGAGTSLWLAFHDDLADPQNRDRVLRESTRLVAAAATATQATYDVLQWRDILGDAVLQFMKESDEPGFYGLKTMEELRGAEGRKIRADVDMLGLISKDDPPVFLTSTNQHDALRNLGDVYHTSRHAVTVKKRCDEVGVTAVLKITGGAQGSTDEENPLEFLLRYLNVR